MKNFFTMKTDTLIEELLKAGIAVPYHENGNPNRKECARLLMELEGAEAKAERHQLDRCLCVLHGGSTESEQQAQFVSIATVGGASYDCNIPREVEVDIPGYVFDFLEEAHTVEYIPTEDPNTNKVTIVPKKIKRFKLTLIDRYVR